MKNIMKMIVAITAVYAVQMEAVDLKSNEAFEKEYSKGNVVLFELYNKDNKAVDVNFNTIKVTGGSLTQALNTNIPSGGTSRALYKINNPNNSNEFKIDLVIQSRDGNDYLFTITPKGKKAYVTFNTEKSPALYPQTGPLMGLKGKTESDLSKKDILSKSDIVEVPNRFGRNTPPWEVLGVAKNASEADISKAARTLLSEFHEQRYSANAQMLAQKYGVNTPKKANEAYTRIGNARDTMLKKEWKEDPTWNK